ncbi:hypothetical protein EJB05_00698, partial [Eragrostis curvula]
MKSRDTWCSERRASQTTFHWGPQKRSSGSAVHLAASARSVRPAPSSRPPPPPPRHQPASPPASPRMVRDVGALHRPPGRTFGAGAGGDENAPPGAPAAPRPPLRAIQPPASGAPRGPVPTARNGWGIRTSKAPAVRTSLALRKPGAKLPLKSELKTAGTSSVEEPRYKIRDAISFWEENHSTGKNSSSALQQCGSRALAMRENSADGTLTRYSEDILELQLELDILKTIFVEEITAHAEVEKTNGLDGELKAANLHILEASRQKEAAESELNKARSVIEALESKLVISINESEALKENNEQILGLLKKRDKEISSLNSELDIYRGKEHMSYEDPIMRSFKFFDTQDTPLSTNPKRDQASHVKACNLNTRCQQYQAFHSSTEQEKDEVCCQAENVTAEVIISLDKQLDASKKGLDKQNELNKRLVEVMKQNDELSTHNSLLESKLLRSDELARALSFDLKMVQEQESVSVVKEKADALTKAKESIASLEQELASKTRELDVVVSGRQQLEAQILSSNEKVAVLEEELAKKFDELNIFSMENAELNSQLKQIERINCTVEDIAHKNKIIARLEEDLLELRSYVGERNIYFESMQNNLSKLSDEKQCLEAQVLIFKKKLEMVQSLRAESEAIAIEAQQKAEERKAYADEKDKQVKLLERSNEDLEITVCELENKVEIIMEEAKQQRMQREELELKLQNIRQQTLDVPSSRNASCSLEDEMVDFVDSTRHSQDVQNELLDAQQVSEKEQGVLGFSQEGPASCMISCKQHMGTTSPFEELMQGAKASNGEFCADAFSFGDISKGDTNDYFPDSHALPKITSRKPNPYPTVEATEPPIVAVEPAPLTEDAEEPSEESPSDEGLQEPKQTGVEMEVSLSSDEDYQPEITAFDQPSPDEHLELEQYSTRGQTRIYGVGVDSDQSQQLSPPAIEPVVQIVEENELPPLALVRSSDPVNYMRAPSDELKKLRNRNHYEGQRTATDRRFWSIEQQDLYNSVYSRAKLAGMKWIDWKHIANIEQFAGVRKRCAHLGLEKIMSYCCHWDSELIRQFYATVHISADKTSMTWMSDGRKITANKRAWEERFGIPSCIHTEIHSQLFLNDDDKRILYTAAEYTLGHISGLSPLASIANKILRTTIYPRFGNTTHSWNVLHHIVEQHPFDIIALIFGEVDLLISDHSRVKDPLLYAPYIMGMITRAFEYRGPRESRHNSYKPRPHKSKVSKKTHPPAAGATPAVVSPLEPTLSAEVAATGHEAHVEAGDDHNQFEATGHQPRVEAVQGRADGCSSSHTPAPNSSVAPSLQANTTPASPQAPVTPFLPSSVHADTPAVSTQPVHVRPCPFGGFRWYQKK